MKKSQYNNRLEWARACPLAHQSAINSGRIQDVCDYFGWEMPKQISRNPHCYWTKERVIVDAQRFNYAADWRTKSNKAYQAALRNRWDGEARLHMIDMQDYYENLRQREK